ncbi:uncharacterized protein ColSpa_09705 [Colletotrichum spaethianum]|uniref:Uncharacterized protein n=1 Tax=Colletotrichum spaethianum TaxID=700344 RepID=A0AA37PC76_9PEZI|nr:uncharacterized protein ColSpa_09705 [Colletotrichum spaethianum]GKT49524.1 hypothetical protein ColSpa_09705 [Colletotrichum spaethianum]
MARHRRPISSAASPDASRKLRVAKKTTPEAKLTTKAHDSPSSDIKKKPKATQQPEKANKREITTTVLPPAKRQKISNTKPTEAQFGTSDFDATKSQTPKKTTLSAQKDSSKPRFQTLPETPTKVTKKKVDEPSCEIQEDSSESDPQPIVVHSGRTRRLQSEIARLKSQIARVPKLRLTKDFASADGTRGMPPKTTANPHAANKDAHQDKEQLRDEHTTTNDKLGRIPKVPEGYMLLTKTDHLTLVRRTDTVKRMAKSFMKSAGDVADTKGDKKNTSLICLLAEAHSLYFGIESLTNALTKLPVTKIHENDVSTEQASDARQVPLEERSLKTTEKPTVAKEVSTAAAKQVAEGPESPECDIIAATMTQLTNRAE